MIAIIRYKTPYILAHKGPFVISFALDNDVSLRCVLGLPTLLAMGTSTDLVKGLLLCIELNRSFPLDLQPPGKGLPEGASLNHYSHTVFSNVSTNITNTNSMLYYTSTKGTPRPLCLRTNSDNIHVTDQFFHDTVTRELSYVSSNSSTASPKQLTFPHVFSCSTFPNPGDDIIPPNSLVNVITVPPKIWQPKVKN